MRLQAELDRDLDAPLSPPPADPGGDAPERVPLRRWSVLRAFLSSPEHARLEPPDRELIWVDELLDAMESACWTWYELDLETFEAFLLDGLSWAIECAPEDPARVARVLDAFLGFAGRKYGAPHAAECCAYLQSAAAVSDIERWVRPCS
jgi:hypothetical protein